MYVRTHIYCAYTRCVDTYHSMHIIHMQCAYPIVTDIKTDPDKHEGSERNTIVERSAECC